MEVALNRQVTSLQRMQAAATINGPGSQALVDGINGAQMVEVSETGGGTCTLAIQGSMDGTVWYAVGYQQVDGVVAPARAVANISVLAGSAHVYQVLDRYKFLRTVMSATAGGAIVTTRAYCVPVA